MAHHSLTHDEYTRWLYGLYHALRLAGQKSDCHTAETIAQFGKFR